MRDRDTRNVKAFQTYYHLIDCRLPHKTKEAKQKEVRKQVVSLLEKGTGKTLKELKEKHSDKSLFRLALKHITTTSRCISESLNLVISSNCRYKQNAIEDGILKESKDNHECPWSKSKAKLLTTNRDFYEEITENYSRQTNMFSND